MGNSNKITIFSELSNTETGCPKEALNLLSQRYLKLIQTSRHGHEQSDLVWSACSRRLDQITSTGPCQPKLFCDQTARLRKHYKWWEHRLCPYLWAQHLEPYTAKYLSCQSHFKFFPPFLHKLKRIGIVFSYEENYLLILNRGRNKRY